MPTRIELTLITLENTTDLLKIVVLKINDDVLVNERPKPMGQLKNIMAATAWPIMLHRNFTMLRFVKSRELER